MVEDSVCGSGHCHLVPFWAKELDKSEIAAFQASNRGGEIACRMRDDGRAMLGGKAVLYADIFSLTHSFYFIAAVSLICAMSSYFLKPVSKA